MLSVVTHPNPLLQQPCVAVAQFDQQLRLLADAMAETMYAQQGVGLAAPQVGELRRVVVVDHTGTGATNALQVLVNPRVTWRSHEVDADDEGCLSIPGVRLTVVRSLVINVEYNDLTGKLQSLRCDGLQSRVVQHEIDHLDGILMFARVGPLQRKLVGTVDRRGRTPEDYRTRSKDGTLKN